jgi:hypothetical protein
MATGGADIAFPALAEEGTSQAAEAASEAIKAMPAEGPWPAAATSTQPWLTVTEALRALPYLTVAAALRTQPWLTVAEALRTQPYLTVAAVVDMQAAVVNMQVVAADTAAAVGAKHSAQQITSGEAPSFAAFFALTIR